MKTQRKKYIYIYFFLKKSYYNFYKQIVNKYFIKVKFILAIIANLIFKFKSKCKYKD